LGLAAVDGIVRSAQGFIKVRSVPGSGTTFQVFLPASRKKLPEDQVRGPVSLPANGSATILVVDDEEALRELTSITLKRCGYQVLEARNGKEALQVLAEAPSLPDIVLLDLAMPVMGGDELLPILSANFAGLRVIFSSGYSEDETRKVLPSQSVAGFLQKPYTSRALKEKIQQVLAAPPLTLQGQPKGYPTARS
jgi:two-component system cell cycle sensor histidine kinase/response regulator CckA